MTESDPGKWGGCSETGADVRWTQRKGGEIQLGRAGRGTADGGRGGPGLVGGTTQAQETVG